MPLTRAQLTLYVEYDAALPDGDSETLEREIEVTVTGTWCRAEPDVGYMHDWFEDVMATDAEGRMVHLSDVEIERAEELLHGARACDLAEAAEYRAELQRDAALDGAARVGRVA